MPDVEMFFPDHLIRRTVQLRFSRSDLPINQWSLGTGFVFDVEDTQYILTAAHVIPIWEVNPYGRWEIQQRRLAKWETLHCTHKLPHVDIEKDLAIIRPDTKLMDSQEVKVTGSAKLGQEVLIAGFPVVDDFWSAHTPTNRPYPHVRRGWIESWIGSPEIYHVDGFVAGGYSGGPVINTISDTNEAQLLGIVSSTPTDRRRFPVVNAEGHPVPGLFYSPPQGIVRVIGITGILSIIADAFGGGSS